MGIELRRATSDDAPRQREIERLAGEQFRSVGMPEIADAAPFSVEELVEYSDAGRSWVATDGPTIVGYLVVDRAEAAGHIEQVSVVPEAQGRGISRLLVDEARRWAGSNRFAALTLTTFRDVAWNEPLYAHLGFRTLLPDELSADLIAVRDREASQGLDPERRICMRLELAPGPTA